MNTLEKLAAALAERGIPFSTGYTTAGSSLAAANGVRMAHVTVNPEGWAFIVLARASDPTKGKTYWMRRPAAITRRVVDCLEGSAT